MRTTINFPLAIVLACAAIIALTPASLFAETGRPNIVFIVADNLGYGEVGAYGGVPMTPQASGDILHRASPAAPGAGATGIEKLHGPLGARVLPEPLKVLVEQMSPDTLQVVLQDLLEPDLLMLREVLRSLEQAPRAFVGVGS
jgi:hypothetical protein